MRFVVLAAATSVVLRGFPTARENPREKSDDVIDGLRTTESFFRGGGVNK